MPIKFERGLMSNQFRIESDGAHPKNVKVTHLPSGKRVKGLFCVEWRAHINEATTVVFHMHASHVEFSADIRNWHYFFHNESEFKRHGLKRIN